MNKIAVIFPGQGSQFIGMGQEFYQNFSIAKNYFHRADEILGYSLSKIIFEGPEDELRLTKHTQPAILLTSIAIWSALKEHIDIKVDFMAGHSLGEYSALTASGSISFEDAIQLVGKRGQFMEEAVPSGEGTMAAIMGMERKDLEAVCDEITEMGHSTQLANMNTASQIVISGTAKGVEMVGKLAKEKDARRVIPLSVSGPFHSRLMQPAKDKLEPLVNNTLINVASIPVVMNVTATPESNPLEIKKNLLDQVVSPVLWVDTIEWMISNGVDTFIEMGPGKVLSGLVKKINRNVLTYSVEDLASFESLKDNLNTKVGI